MTVLQGVFLVALSIVVLAALWFAGVVAVAARTSDGGAYPSWRLLARMARPGADRGELNRWAFYAHRISGAAVFAFLCLHIVDVSIYTFSRPLYDSVHQLYGTWPMRIFECALLFAIVFHTLNGLRLLVIDLADVGRAGATRALVAVVGLTAAAGIAGSVVILLPEFS